MNIHNYNLNLESEKIKKLTVRVSKMFSKNGPFVEETEILLRNNNLEIKPEDYIPQTGDELYIFKKNSGINVLKLKV